MPSDPTIVTTPSRKRDGPLATIMVATHRPHFGDEAMQLLAPYDPIRVDGTGFPSCAYLWNQCVVRCPTETVIICNERARPARHSIEALLGKLDEGYALAGLYRFGFFGFPKETLRLVGMFDEGYRGGWYEDNDMILRLREADLGYYESEEIVYLWSPSAWSHSGNQERFQAKWDKAGGWTRKLPEENVSYDLGRSMPLEFLGWNDSVLMAKMGGQYGPRR